MLAIIACCLIVLALGVGGYSGHVEGCLEGGGCMTIALIIFGIGAVLALGVGG